MISSGIEVTRSHCCQDLGRRDRKSRGYGLSTAIDFKLAQGGHKKAITQLVYTPIQFVS